MRPCRTTLEYENLQESVEAGLIRFTPPSSRAARKLKKGASRASSVRQGQSRLDCPIPCQRRRKSLVLIANEPCCSNCCSNEAVSVRPRFGPGFTFINGITVRWSLMGPHRLRYGPSRQPSLNSTTAALVAGAKVPLRDRCNSLRTSSVARNVIVRNDWTAAL